MSTPAMCGRFTLRTPLSRLLAEFDLRTDLEFTPRYNIAPSQSVPAARAANGTRELVLLKWGLVPAWANNASIGNRMINARGETVAEKPSFRSAFKNRRCLILTDGWYEWRKQDTAKQPYLIHLSDDRPFALAGLWETWRGPDGAAPLESCTIITTGASQPIRHVHDRMPVILDPRDYDRWLDPELHDRAQLEPLLAPWDSTDLEADAVSTHVNNPRHDDAKCVQRISPGE